MVNQPWIKIFVGDWIRDTRKLSMRARGAYADLKMHLWISDIRGVITGDITDVSLLLGISYTETESLLQELQQKKAFKIELCNNTCYNIIDETMILQTAKSTVKSKAGKEGQRIRWENERKKKQNPVITNDISTVITPDITYNGIGIGNGIDNDFKEGVQGEKILLSQKIKMPWPSVEFQNTWESWKQYKKEKHTFTFTLQMEQHALEQLWVKTSGDDKKAISIITTAIANGWKNLEDYGKSGTGKEAWRGSDSGRRSTAKEIISGDRGFYDTPVG